MPDTATTAAAIAEPRAGDVWVSKRMVRMVTFSILSGYLRYHDPFHHQSNSISMKSFRRWARTAKLVHRGKG